MILKLLPIDSPDVEEPKNYPQRMLEVYEAESEVGPG